MSAPEHLVKYDDARRALHDLLWELPAEFSEAPPEANLRNRLSFQVIKRSNVRKVHRALWELQEYFGMTEE